MTLRKSLGLLSITLTSTLAITVAGNAQAEPVMPSYSSGTSGWTTDRYEPNSFSILGAYQGRNDVLGIGISSAQNAANRGGQSGMFYNTQGRQHAITGGAGASLSAALYVEAGWGNSANGLVRSDVWGVMSDSSNGITDYPIIGFTNQGGSARYRVYDGDVASNNGWIDLSTTVAFGAWTSFDMVYHGGKSMEYFVNGTSVYTDATIGYGLVSEGFSGVIMQAYNFGDPTNFPGANASDYTAHWSNTAPIPEPETYAMMLAGLGLLGVVARRRKQKSVA